MFLPLGFFLERIFKKNRVKTVGLCFLGVLLFEVSQFVLRIGYFDVDDIILNISGCVIGILISIIKIKKEGK